jgi:hypothetical protein
MEIRRRNHGRGHSYTDGETGAKVAGVTTIMSAGLPKPALISWTGDATADYAIDHWAELDALPISERWKRIKKGRFEALNNAANKGRKIHKIAERLMDGQAVEIPEDLDGYVQACVAFLDGFDFQPEYVEAVVYSDRHKHAGTLDAIGTLLLPDLEELDDIPRDPDTGRSRGLIDWKSGGSGIFGDVAFQFAGYRFSEWMIDPATGEVIEMPGVDFCGAVHLTRFGTFEFKPVTVEKDQYRDFLYINEVARIAETSRDLVGEAIPPVRTSRFRLVAADQESSDDD